MTGLFDLQQQNSGGAVANADGWQGGASRQSAAPTMSHTSIPRKFQMGVDEATWETEKQQLYSELDDVRAQLDEEVAKNVALKRAKERAEAEVKALRGKGAAGTSSPTQALRREVERLEEENTALLTRQKAADSELKEAHREIDRLR